MSLEGFVASPRQWRSAHFIREWDEEGRRYICECGARSPTATDHEWHVLWAKRGQ